jgi:DNA helicase-2/ATP-dependent DNA helicase PcrA
MNLSDLLSEIVNQSGYETFLRLNGEQDRLDNLAELKQSIFEYESSYGEEVVLEDYLHQLSLLTNIDKNNNKDAVKMMTIHSAKGLEFPYVFVCGLSEGIFPSKSIKTLEELEEERRLAYVAITRAENKLFLSDSEGVNFDHSFRYPSRFIFNVEKDLLKFEEELNSDLIESAHNYIISHESFLTLDKNNLQFKIGDHIVHPVFGDGYIEEINESSSCYVVSFEQLSTQRSMNFETLEKIAQLKNCTDLT